MTKDRSFQHGWTNYISILLKFLGFNFQFFLNIHIDKQSDKEAFKHESQNSFFLNKGDLVYFSYFIKLVIDTGVQNFMGFFNFKYYDEVTHFRQF